MAAIYVKGETQVKRASNIKEEKKKKKKFKKAQLQLRSKANSEQYVETENKLHRVKNSGTESFSEKVGFQSLSINVKQEVQNIGHMHNEN